MARVNRQQLQGDMRLPPPSGVTEGCVKFSKTCFENNQSIWLGTPLNSPSLESDWERAMADGRSLPFHFRLLLKMSTINFFICFRNLSFNNLEYILVLLQAAFGRPPFSGGVVFFIFFRSFSVRLK
jgi:hypothetical protein